jgi:hypothetical protein
MAPRLPGLVFDQFADSGGGAASQDNRQAMTDGEKKDQDKTGGDLLIRPSRAEMTPTRVLFFYTWNAF